jgi:hypothetical protein
LTPDLFNSTLISRATAAFGEQGHFDQRPFAKTMPQHINVMHDLLGSFAIAANVKSEIELVEDCLDSFPVIGVQAY